MNYTVIHVPFLTAKALFTTPMPGANEIMLAPIITAHLGCICTMETRGTINASDASLEVHTISVSQLNDKNTRLNQSDCSIYPNTEANSVNFSLIIKHVMMALRLSLGQKNDTSP